MAYRLAQRDGQLQVISAANIDAGIGPAYDVKLVDLDADGKRELLVTNHVGGNGGGLFAYDVPADISRGNFTKHVLATGFKVRPSSCRALARRVHPGPLPRPQVTEGGFNQAAPGFAYTFTPKVGSGGPKWIAVAGDGSQRAYLLRPSSSSSSSAQTPGIRGGAQQGRSATEACALLGCCSRIRPSPQASRLRTR